MSVEKQGTPLPMIDTGSPNAVSQWIKIRRRQGKFRRCANLGIDEVKTNSTNTGAEAIEETFYVPSCERHSFEWDQPLMPEELKLHRLHYTLQETEMSCPANCYYYENLSWGKLKNRCVDILVVIRGWAKSFQTFPWQTQVALIFAFVVLPVLMLILWKTPQWVPYIADLIRAVRGH